MNRWIGAKDVVSVVYSRRTRPAIGVRRRPGAPPKISITFDQAQFDRINDLAEQSGATFAEQVRCLIALAFDHIGEDRP